MDWESWRAREYFSKNWGALPVIGFTLIMLIAFSQYNFGSSFDGPPPAYAIVATFLLILGIALQIASYLFYRKRSET